MMSLNISTLNLCLGLRNKEYLVKNLLDEQKTDILCMQETEVTKDININELMTSNYCLELENNSVKSRVGFHIINMTGLQPVSRTCGVISNCVILCELVCKDLHSLH